MNTLKLMPGISDSFEYQSLLLDLENKDFEETVALENLYLNLFEEEKKEFHDAKKEKDIIGIIDGYCDMHVVASGLYLITEKIKKIASSFLVRDRYETIEMDILSDLLRSTVFLHLIKSPSMSLQPIIDIYRDAVVKSNMTRFVDRGAAMYMASSKKEPIELRYHESIDKYSVHDETGKQIKPIGYKSPMEIMADLDPDFETKIKQFKIMEN